MRLSLNKVSTGIQARRSRQCEIILDRLQTMPGHFTAEELWLSLVRRGPRVSRATVYRTLEMLVDRGVLQRVQLDERGAKYEVIQGRPQHAHLYCLGCAKLMDYRLPTLARLPERVRRTRGFEVAHLLLRICGYCESCRARNSSRYEEPLQKKRGRRTWER